MNATARIAEQWDVSRYPFDTQTLSIRIEDMAQSAQSLRFDPDEVSSGISDQAFPNGWRLLTNFIRSEENYYPTTFGEPGDRSW